MYIALTIIDVILALGIIAAVLLQSGKSAGLSGSIAGGAEMLFGGKKKGLDELLAKVTKWVAVAFLVVTIILAFFDRYKKAYNFVHSFAEINNNYFGGKEL